MSLENSELENNLILNLYDLFNDINLKFSNNEKNNDLTIVMNSLINYNGNDWKDYIIKNYNYHKNLIYKNNKLEIYIITWMPGASTRIHDHPEKGCLVKILQGILTETEYINDDNLILYKNTIILNKNDMGFKISNKILHKINNNTNEIAVSLHIYSLPDFKITYF